MGITGKELAKKLKLSETAVSMALHNKPGVSIETRRKVLKAAERYGYDFDRIERTNTNRRKICLIVGNYLSKKGSVTSFFEDITAGINQILEDEMCQLDINMLNSMQLSENYINELLMNIRAASYSGLILLGADMPKFFIQALLVLSIPIVLIDTFYEDLPCSAITVNNRFGGAIAANYLASKYLEEPGYLRCRYRVKNFDKRINGFMERLRDDGWSRHKVEVFTLSHTIEGAKADMENIIKKGEPLCRAYFAETDMIAIGAIKALQENGYRVPEDVAIMGFENITLAPLINPKLTTIDIPSTYMGQLAAEKILELLKYPTKHTSNTKVSVSLIERESA